MTFYFLHLKNMPIFEQLQLEEALLRSATENYCLINEGSTPAIVMGISAKMDELVDLPRAKEQKIPIIRRFSGGGTVVVDEETFFCTFISQRDLHTFSPFPEPILKWSFDIHQRALPFLTLAENDYCVGAKKCGGNAQYIQKNRWLHHSSFLWDYKKERMELLLLPKKTPSYRQGRAHAAFITPLYSLIASKEVWIAAIKESLRTQYEVVDITLSEARDRVTKDHRKATLIESL